MKIIILLCNWLIIGLSFIFINYLKRETFILSSSYTKLLFAFYLSWLAVAYITKKFQTWYFKGFFQILYREFLSIIYLLMIIAFIVVIFNLTAFSRSQIIGTCFLIFISELTMTTLFYILNKSNKITSNKNERFHESQVFSYNPITLTIDFFLLVFAIFITNYFINGSFLLSEHFYELTGMIGLLWLMTGIFTGKFSNKHHRNVWYAWSPVIKSILLMASGLAFSIFSFRLFHFSRFEIFGSLAVLGISETFILFSYYFIFKKKSRIADVETISEVRDRISSNNKIADETCYKKSSFEEYIKTNLEDNSIQSVSDLINFISNIPEIAEFKKEDSSILDTNNIFNLKNIKEHSLKMFVNLHKVNDFQQLNKYFLEVYRRLKPGGFFLGKVVTNTSYKNEFFQKYPKYIAEVFYTFHFIFRRVLPKLPVLKNIINTIANKTNRMLSKAETLGRLYFCGYKVVGVTEIDGNLFFMAQKVNIPSLDKNPSYGLIIKLKRIGLDGKVFNLYKCRTMHPYSEFLQEYIYEQNKLLESGKILNDFRITSWGKVFRKFWIDELPQIVNYLKGDLNIIGVRALSKHYFSLYPEYVQKLRIKCKNGLIPPYYADMPKNFDEIIESEERYLYKKLKNPILTDIIYFFRAMNNIVLKKARSM